MVTLIRIKSVVLLLLLSCSTKELTKTSQIIVLEFADFVENPEQFKGQDIGVKGYYVEGLPQLYKDKAFYESVSGVGRFDSSKFDYLHMIELPKYNKIKRPTSLTYLEGAYVIVYGRPTHLDLADKPIRYGGYLNADSVVLQKSH